MANYMVQWAIDIIDAKDAEDAARRAFAIIQKPDTVATVFTVYNERGAVCAQIDLAESK